MGSIHVVILFEDRFCICLKSILSQYFLLAFFLAIGYNFIRCKVNKTVFTSPGDEYYNCLLTKCKISTIPDCTSDLITSWFVMRRNEKKKTKRKINFQSFSLWEQISFGKLIPIEKKSSGKPAFKLHEIHCIIMIYIQQSLELIKIVKIVRSSRADWSVEDYLLLPNFISEILAVKIKIIESCFRFGSKNNYSPPF